MKDNRRYFFISDTHFSHANIIKYCNRPFIDIKSMNEKIISNWNSVVTNDDVVYHLGDVILGNKEDANDIIGQLNGIKYLVKGNHDMRQNQFYRDLGFKEVYDHPIIIKDFIVLSHEPMPFVMNQMYFNVHGHVHDSPMFQTKGQNCACVCVERWNYMPVKDTDIFGFSLHGYGHRAPMSFDNADGSTVVHF